MKISDKDQIKYFDDKITHLSAGGFVFFESGKDKKLYVALLIKKDGCVMIPKGHIKKDEEAKNAALREVKEELMLLENPEIIADIGYDQYAFYLDGDQRKHYKKVYLYAFRMKNKANIAPLEKEDFVEAKWFEFNEALSKITFDRKNLLKARQVYYLNKSVKTYKNLSDIKSLVVAMPVFNGSKTIINALKSVLASFNELPKSIACKIYISFDHCTDNSEELVKDFINKDKLENIVTLNNSGLKGKSTTLNKIVSNSLSDIICVVDDDVILDKGCLIALIRELINHDGLRCVFARWIRARYTNKNPWKKLLHWILGVKFDIQPFDQPSEMMRGSCMMLRRDDYVKFPDGIYNEDQFLQYMYWPHTKEVNEAFLYFNSVSNITDYYKRFIRITVGNRQLSDEFTQSRINDCNKDLYRKIDYNKIFKLPARQYIPFLLYRFVRIFVNFIVKIRLSLNKNHEWFRIKQP